MRVKYVQHFAQRFIVATIVLSATIACFVTAPSVHSSPAGTTALGKPTPSPASFAITTSVEPLATTDPISVAGVDPTTVALSWQQSGDWCFTDYRIQDSTTGSSGPWTTVDTVTSSGSTELYWTAFGPGQTVWFQDIDDSACGGGSATSNVVQATFPNYASVSYSDNGASTVQLSWNNNANYGGLLGFDSYQVEEQINGGGFSSLATITSESTTTYSISGVTGLNTGTVYQFRIVTTDYCNNCQGGSYPNPIDSNTITHMAISQPVASPTSVQAGQSTQLSVKVTGGNGPYTYAWTGLPAGCSSANTNPLTCTPTSSGQSSVTVTVTDSRGITLTSLSVTVTVTQSTGGGGGGGGSDASGSSASGGSLSTGEWVAIVAVAVLAAVVVIALVAERARRSKTPQGQSFNAPSAPPAPWPPPPGNIPPSP